VGEVTARRQLRGSGRGRGRLGNLRLDARHLFVAQVILQCAQAVDSTFVLTYSTIQEVTTMGGPIIRTGPSQQFSDNWDTIFCEAPSGKGKTKSKAAKKAAPKKKGAKKSPKKAAKKKR
jgi:hypothetical protein